MLIYEYTSIVAAPTSVSVVEYSYSHSSGSSSSALLVLNVNGVGKGFCGGVDLGLVLYCTPCCAIMVCDSGADIFADTVHKASRILKRYLENKWVSQHVEES